MHDLQQQVIVDYSLSHSQRRVRQNPAGAHVAATMGHVRQHRKNPNPCSVKWYACCWNGEDMSQASAESQERPALKTTTTRQKSQCMECGHDMYTYVLHACAYPLMASIQMLQHLVVSRVSNMCGRSVYQACTSCDPGLPLIFIAGRRGAHCKARTFSHLSITVNRSSPGSC